MTTMEQDEKTPDFDALRAERNRILAENMEHLSKEFAIPITFDPAACFCACWTGGPCEHRWDGEFVQFDDGCGWTATCSRCGGTAWDHSLRVGP